ncbi:hypothetical protein MMPV_002437 [Pyropia vietnamensis]
MPRLLVVTAAVAALASPALAVIDNSFITSFKPKGVPYGSQAVFTDTFEVNGVSQTVPFRKLLSVDQKPPYGGTWGIKPTGSSSAKPDFVSLMPHSNGYVYSAQHFEDNAGSLYMSQLVQDPATGELFPTATMPIDFKAVGGTTRPCSGSVTPWNTHLSSEEKTPDGRNNEKISDLLSTVYRGNSSAYSAYRYGHPIEVGVTASGYPRVVAKHYALARLSYEMAYVMPDKKTTYLMSDKDNSPMMMFVADKPEDLTAGNLFTAKLTQTSSANGGAFSIKWLPMGHATKGEIEALVEGGIRFSDMFESTSGSSGSCPAGFSSSNAGDYGFECLKVKPGMEMAASRLESYRYAGVIGGTTELNKMEGVTFHASSNSLFMASSYVRRGMTSSSEYDRGTANDMTLPGNECGCVFRLKVDPKTYIAADFVAEVCGSTSGSCSSRGLANPDNLNLLGNTLLVAEDTSRTPAQLWAYDITSKTLTSMAVVPNGAEATGAYVSEAIGDYVYVTVVAQHPDSERAFTGYWAINVKAHRA